MKIDNLITKFVHVVDNNHHQTKTTQRQRQRLHNRIGNRIQIEQMNQSKIAKVQSHSESRKVKLVVKHFVR